MLLFNPFAVVETAPLFYVGIAVAMDEHVSRGKVTSNNAEGKQVSDAYLLRKIVEGKDGDKDCQTDNQLEN